MKRIKSFILKDLYKFKGIILIIFYVLLHPFEWVFNKIKYEILAYLELKKFNRAKKEANHKHATTGKRYHVLPGGNNKLAVVDNTYIKYYNKTKGVKKINIHTLLKMAYYSTN